MTSSIHGDEPPTTIGSLNGPWSVLLRAHLVVATFALPFLITWATWATLKITGTDTHATRQELHEAERSLQTQLNNLPPAEWRDRVRENEKGRNVLEQQLARITVLLEEIKRQ